jgi:GR25 family glycosyltransferase involved in LPS biosynthesis
MSWIRKNIIKNSVERKMVIPPIPQVKLPMQSEIVLPKQIHYIDTQPSLRHIDAIFYINLEHREDRKEHCLNEIKKIDPQLSKTHRINAVYNKENGALGCLASHIKALELFIKNDAWQILLIFEDDYTFVSDKLAEINGPINHLFNTLPDFDVLLLCQSADSFISENTKYYNILRVLSAQTTSAYIINKKYANILLDIFKDAYDKMSTFGFKTEWCADQCWKQLMPSGKWYTNSHRIGYQYDNYSDIERKLVSYGC